MPLVSAHAHTDPGRQAAGRAVHRCIVNADDFGLSTAVNAGIISAHRDGILTSATLLANAPAFDDAVRLTRAAPRLGVGVHLNIVRGTPLSPPESIPLLTGADGSFLAFRYRAMTADFLRQAEAEYRLQLEKAAAAGIRPTHIDFEKHHAWQGPLYRLACRLAAEHGIRAVRCLREPVLWSARALGWPGGRRAFMSAALRCGVRFFGAEHPPLFHPEYFLGQWRIGEMTEAVWLRLLPRLPAGTSEVMTHPGITPPGGETGKEMGASWIDAARQLEYGALVSPAVRRAAEDNEVHLIHFGDL